MKFDISLLISCFICGIVEIYAASKILEKNFFFNKKILAVGIFILTLYHFLAYQLTNNFLRTIILLFLIILLIKAIYKENFSKTIISSFLSWLILFISEIIFMILITSLFKFDATKVTESNSVTAFFINMGIYIIDIIIIHINFIYKFCIKICEKINNVNNKYLLLIILIIVITFSIQLYLFYVPISQTLKLILNLIIFILYSNILVFLFTEKNENIKMQQNISYISENLNEYEKMLDYQRVANHENKNQLLVIKGKIKKGDKDIIEYIDNIIKDNREDNEDFYYKTKMIPSGGLQGLIYYKSLVIKEKNINFTLDIDRKIRNYNFKKLTTDQNCAICKILGVWIDNAIQASENCKKPKIIIEMKLTDNSLILVVANNFNGEMNLEKIDKIGYTTKGKGHGYGLSIVKNIVDKNVIFDNKKAINGSMFTQKLFIKTDIN